MSRSWWEVLLGRVGKPEPQDRNRPPLSGDDSARWAEIAEAMKFDQLARVRGLAEQWRTGLIALTALIGVVSLVRGPQTAQELPAGARTGVGVLLVVAFLLLLVGSVLSMLAAYGPLGPQDLVTGERLRRWDAEQVQSARLQLLCAQVAMVAGLLLLGAAAATAYASTALPEQTPATDAPAAPG